MKQLSVTWVLIFSSILFLVVVIQNGFVAVEANSFNKTGAEIMDIMDVITEDYTLPYHSGKLKREVIINSTGDEKASIVIPAGTMALDSKGYPLRTIELHHIDIGAVAAYEFRPSKYQFSPSVNMSITYDPSDIPEGVNESSLRVKKFEGGEWAAVENSINVTTNTVTTRISQCSIIALFSPPPVNNTVVESDVSTITEPVSQSPAPESTKSPTDNNLKPAVWGEDTEPTEDEEVEEETPGFTAIIAFTAVLTAVFLNKRIIKPR